MSCAANLTWIERSFTSAIAYRHSTDITLIVSFYIGLCRRTEDTQSTRLKTASAVCVLECLNSTNEQISPVAVWCYGQWCFWCISRKAMAKIMKPQCTWSRSFATALNSPALLLQICKVTVLQSDCFVQNEKEITFSSWSPGSTFSFIENQFKVI